MLYIYLQTKRSVYTKKNDEQFKRAYFKDSLYPLYA